MLESTSDYLAVLSIIAIFVAIIMMVLYLHNLRVIDRNVRKEIRYYQYDRDRKRIADKKKKWEISEK